MEGKQIRKPNWNSDESLALASLVDDYKHILRGKLSHSLTSDMKTRAWGEVAQKLCAMGVGPSRTPAEVEKKWHNIFSHSKSEISSFRRTVSGTGGGPPLRPLSAIAETVSNVVGQHNACLSGIDGGIDSSLLQILGDSEQIGLGIHVIEGPPDIEPHIISTGTTQDTAATITSPPPARTAASQQTPATHAEYSSSTSLKRRIEELTVKKLELEVGYLRLKIRKLKGEE